MHLDVTAEVLASQLKIGNTETALAQIEKAIENTNNFHKFAKHIISLNDKLKPFDSFIALSNSVPHFKIKCEDELFLSDFTEELEHWSKKYNVELEKVENKNVYYIKGIK
ncbi:MAG: hypothetical protein U9Q30_09505 [Campylobacterota bacterium]|nr:hypothetical protein [Campylobacterota bacterium]